MRIDKIQIAEFTATLLKWNKDKNDRKMPWKGEKDPYRIWLSEIILQQTRVEQGTSYYQRFINVFPNIHSLAKAKDENIYKLWEGLGYYNRCKNLIETARFISKDRSGVFPNTYEDILALKGVGNYTASAIASFAYNLPHAVVDGNVYRVLSRVFGIRQTIDSSAGKNLFAQLANDLLDKNRPGIHNQSLMDFGAVICKPQNPTCLTCPMNKICVAYKKNIVNELPVKKKKLQVKDRWFNYLVISNKSKIYIRKRTDEDIWKNLYEFPLIETGKKVSVKSILSNAEKSGLFAKGDYELISVSPLYTQLLSHQKIHGRFIRINLKNTALLNGFKAVSHVHISRYAFPRLMNTYLQDLD